MFNSLVFVTSNHKISTTDPKKEPVEWHSLRIKFLPESWQVYKQMNEPAGPFMVIESDAFFESYSHVLKGMKEFTEYSLPMQKYIVR